MLRQSTRSFSLFAPKWVSRFQVPAEVRLRSPVVRQQAQANSFPGSKITDIYFKLDGVVINPFTTSKKFFVTQGISETIAQLKKMNYRVGVYSSENREKVKLNLHLLAKQGIRFNSEDIATACDVDPHTDLQLGLLQHLKANGKAKNPASVISIFDDSPDASIKLGAWGIGLPSFPVSQEEGEKLNAWQLEVQQKYNLEKLYEQGPNFVTLEAEDILEIVTHADQLMRDGEFPLSCLDVGRIRRFSP